MSIRTHSVRISVFGQEPNEKLNVSVKTGIPFQLKPGSQGTQGEIVACGEEFPVTLLRPLEGSSPEHLRLLRDEFSGSYDLVFYAQNDGASSTWRLVYCEFASRVTHVSWDELIEAGLEDEPSEYDVLGLSDGRTGLLLLYMSNAPFDLEFSHGMIRFDLDANRELTVTDIGEEEDE